MQKIQKIDKINFYKNHKNHFYENSIFIKTLKEKIYNIIKNGNSQFNITLLFSKQNKVLCLIL